MKNREAKKKNLNDLIRGLGLNSSPLILKYYLINLSDKVGFKPTTGSLIKE